MSVYLATYQEPNVDRIRQIDRIARQFKAGFFTLDSKEELVENMMALGTWPTSATYHSWVPLELNAKAVPLSTFDHPENVVYVLGSQISTIPSDVLDLLGHEPVFVETPPIGSPVLPTPVVAGIVMHHRLTVSKFGELVA